MFGKLFERILSCYFCNLKAMNDVKLLIESLPDYVNRCLTMSLDMERDILNLIDKMRDFQEMVIEIYQKYDLERLSLNFDEVYNHSIDTECSLKDKCKHIIEIIDDMSSN